MRSRYEAGDRLRSPATGDVWVVLRWTHSVVLQNERTGQTSAIPSAWADEYERVADEGKIMAAGCTGDQKATNCTCNCPSCGGSVPHGQRTICRGCFKKPKN